MWSEAEKGWATVGIREVEVGNLRILHFIWVSLCLALPADKALSLRAFSAR